MTITREQVADLRPGDVVRVTGWQGLTVEGPVGQNAFGDVLWLGQHCRLTRPEAEGAPFWTDGSDATLTVVSRAPRPLYVNHPRTEPVPGDVVRDADSDDRTTWVFGPVEVGSGRLSNPWHNPADDSGRHVLRDGLPARLRLLVDGETGETVPAVRT